MTLIIRVEEAGLGVKSPADNRHEVVHQSGGEGLILVALVNDRAFPLLCPNALYSIVRTAVPFFCL